MFTWWPFIHSGQLPRLQRWTKRAHSRNRAALATTGASWNVCRRSLLIQIHWRNSSNIRWSCALINCFATLPWSHTDWAISPSKSETRISALSHSSWTNKTKAYKHEQLCLVHPLEGQKEPHYKFRNKLISVSPCNLYFQSPCMWLKAEVCIWHIYWRNETSFLFTFTSKAANIASTNGSMATWILAFVLLSSACAS